MSLYENEADNSFTESHDWMADLPEISHVSVPHVHCPLSSDNLRLLQSTINPLATSNYHGKDLYLETVEFVGRSIANSTVPA